MNKPLPHWNDLLDRSSQATMRSMDQSLTLEEGNGSSMSSSSSSSLSSSLRRQVILSSSPGSKRTRTSYIPKGMTIGGKLHSDGNKTSVRSSLLKFLDDKMNEDGGSGGGGEASSKVNFLKNDLLFRANHQNNNASFTSKNTSGTETKMKIKKKHAESTNLADGDLEQQEHQHQQQNEAKVKRRNSKWDKPGEDSSKPSNTRRGSAGTLVTITSTASMEAAPSSPPATTNKPSITTTMTTTTNSNDDTTEKKSCNVPISPPSSNKPSTHKEREGKKTENSKRLSRSSIREDAADTASFPLPSSTPPLPPVSDPVPSPSIDTPKSSLPTVRPHLAPESAATTATTKSPPSTPPSLSTESRVKAVRQQLDISLHQGGGGGGGGGGPPSSIERQLSGSGRSIREGPTLQPRIAGMSLNSVGSAEQRKQASKERLAGLSIERQSIHEKRTSSFHTQSSSGGSEAVDRKAATDRGKPPLLPPRKMKKGSRLAKMKEAQERHGQNDNTKKAVLAVDKEGSSGREVKHATAIPKASLRGCSLQHDSSHEREERRLAARSQLEGISSVLEKRRSNSGSLQSMEQSLKRTNNADPLEESASSTEMDDLDRKLASPVGTSRKGRILPSQVASTMKRKQGISAIALAKSPEENLNDIFGGDDASLGDSLREILQVADSDDRSVVSEASLRILQVFESSLHSLSNQQKADNERETNQSATKSAPMQSLLGGDGSSKVSTETEEDANSFAYSVHSIRGQDSLHAATPASMSNKGMLDVPSPLKKPTTHPLLPPVRLSPEKKDKNFHGNDNLSSPSLQANEKASETRVRESSPVVSSLPSKTRTIPRTSSHRSSSSSLHPKADLYGFLRHLAVLNDLKELTSPSTAEEGSKLLNASLLIGQPQATGKQRSRFQQMFQLKCTLLNILSEDSPKEAELKRQALLNQFDLDPFDLKFVLEHIELCQEENTAIRWDLVRTVFFPDEDDTLDNSKNSGKANSSRKGSFEGHESLPVLDFSASMALGPSSQTKNWNSTTDCTSYWNNSTAGISPLGRSHSSYAFFEDGEDLEEDGSYLSQREEYQEEILVLYEEAEAAMAELSHEERQLRRHVLVQLLQATSEDEAHLTSLTLDDVAEIVHHVRVCRETKTEIQWDMIRDIVFPLGIAKEQLMPSLASNGSEENDGGDEEMKNDSANTFHTSFMSIGNPEQYGIINDVSELGRKNDSFLEFFDLEEEELDVVLLHINICTANNESIRWDLIGEVLFPGDPARQAMLSDRILEGDDTSAADLVQSAHSALQTRKNAILSLSNHSEEFLFHQEEDDLLEAASFGGDDV